jgi:hypothetical protein
METVILFILKAAASGTVGHYLKKGLEKIDTGLRNMFESKQSPSDIASYIKENKLTEQVDELASKLLSTSVLLPFDKTDLAPVEERAVFYLQVLQLGFSLASKWNIDLLLPGSVLGPDSLTVFRLFENADSEIERKGPKISLPANLLRPHLSIVPTNKVDLIWKEFKPRFQIAVEDGEGYTPIEKLAVELTSRSVTEDQTKVFGVRAITAGAIFFQSGPIVYELRPKLIRREDFDSGRVPLQNWESGVMSMMQGIQDLQRLHYIPATEAERLQQLADRIQSLAASVA